MVSGILFGAATPSADSTAEFHQWYEEDHIPSRVALDGLDGAQRYREVGDTGGDPTFAVRYMVSDTTVFGSESFRALRENPSPRMHDVVRACGEFWRFAGECIGTTGRKWTPSHKSLAYVLGFRVPEEFWAEFEAWYEIEHAPILMEEPGWLGCERYRIMRSDESSDPPGESTSRRSAPSRSYTHLVVHELESAAALDGDSRRRARATPWRARLTAHDWQQHTSRWLFEPMTPLTQP